MPHTLLMLNMVYIRSVTGHCKSQSRVIYQTGSSTELAGIWDWIYPGIGSGFRHVLPCILHSPLYSNHLSWRNLSGRVSEHRIICISYQPCSWSTPAPGHATLAKICISGHQYKFFFESYYLWVASASWNQEAREQTMIKKITKQGCSYFKYTQLMFVLRPSVPFAFSEPVWAWQLLGMVMLRALLAFRVRLTSLNIRHLPLSGPPKLALESAESTGLFWVWFISTQYGCLPQDEMNPTIEIPVCSLGL